MTAVLHALAAAPRPARRGPRRRPDHVTLAPVPLSRLAERDRAAIELGFALGDSILDVMAATGHVYGTVRAVREAMS